MTAEHCCCHASHQALKIFYSTIQFTGMGKIPQRIIIYAKDIEIITGRRSRTAYLLMNKVRAHYNKGQREYITIYEFCSYMKIDERVVREVLG